MRIALALLVLLVVAPAAAADTDLATLDHDTTVATFGGRAVWSAYDGPSGRFRLMTWTAATGVAPLGVATRADAFDVDLGPSAGGAVTAVYSRAGRLYAYDFAAATERVLPLRGRRPSLFRSRVAFLRDGALRSAGVDGAKPRVLMARLPRGFGSFDIADHRIGYTTVRPSGAGIAVALRLRDVRSGVDRRLHRSRSGLLSHVSITGVNFDRGNVLGAIKARRGAAGNRVLRYVPRTRRLTQSPAPADVLDGGLTGGSLVYLQAGGEFSEGCADPDDGPCRLRVSP